MNTDNSELPGPRPDLEPIDSIEEPDRRRNPTHDDHADGDDRLTPDPATAPPRWRELLGPEHRGAALVLAAGVLVGAVNIYLASSMLPTAVAEIGGEGLYAWNMTLYLVAMVIATMLVSRFLVRWGNAGAYLIGFALFLMGSLACAVSPTMPVLCVAGSGIGLAYPHLSVAAMSAATDPEEGRQAAAAIATVTTMSTAFGTAVAGVLVSLGGPSLLGSARWLLFGFALLCAIGIFTARAADRTSHPLRQRHQRGLRSAHRRGRGPLPGPPAADRRRAAPSRSQRDRGRHP